MNPVLSESIKNFDISSILSKVNENKIKDAYSDVITLKGVGHKIASLFLRDISYHYFPNQIPNLQDTVYLFPVDIWVRNFIESLKLDNQDTELKKPKDMDKGNFELSQNFCSESLNSRFDPRTMNMGI